MGVVGDKRWMKGSQAVIITKTSNIKFYHPEMYSIQIHNIVMQLFSSVMVSVDMKNILENLI